MPHAAINGASIYYEEAGAGFPLVLVHEFAGSYESWREQVRFLSRHYRVVTYNARGYPPSSVPEDPAAYSQDIAVEDLYQLLRHLNISQGYIGGLSMGGALTVVFGVTHPEMCRALIIAGAGTGSTDPERFRAQCEAFAGRLDAGGMRGLTDYCKGPTRVQLLRKDPAAWQEFADLFYQHSAFGSACTFRQVQGKRPPIFAYKEQLQRLQTPALILAGDEDDPCLEPALFLKRALNQSALITFPRSGHGINLEEPELFNTSILNFLRDVEAGRWGGRQQGDGAGFLIETATP